MKITTLVLLGSLLTTCAGAAEITITVPNQVLERVKEAFSETYKYEEKHCDRGGLNCDITKAQFAKRQVARFIKGVVRAHEVNSHVMTERDNKLSQVKSDLSGIN